MRRHSGHEMSGPCRPLARMTPSRRPRAIPLVRSHRKRSHARPAALRFLHRRFGTWKPPARTLKMKATSVAKAVTGRGRPVSPALAFRVARVAGCGIDDLLAGRFPAPNACPLCGHVANMAEEEK